MKLYLFLFLLPLLSFGQIELPVIQSEEDWEKVIITRNPNDVKDLVPLEEIDVRTMKAFGQQKKLREQTREKLQRECAKLKIPIVLIVKDEFSRDPLNNVTIVGTPYKKVD